MFYLKQNVCLVRTKIGMSFTSGAVWIEVSQAYGISALTDMTMVSFKSVSSANLS